jgi:hypothetical protein
LLIDQERDVIRLKKTHSLLLLFQLLDAALLDKFEENLCDLILEVDLSLYINFLGLLRRISSLPSVDIIFIWITVSALVSSDKALSLFLAHNRHSVGDLCVNNY